MANGDQEVTKAIRSALEQFNFSFDESEIQNATKFSVRSGNKHCAILVYNSGKIVVQGKESDLRTWLNQLKDSIESGSATPFTPLPPEIEKFPQTLRDRVPNCDDVVLWFYQEALKCYKANSPAGAAFMLGAASEKAIILLIETYATSITKEESRKKFLERIKNRAISKKYDEFKNSYKGCKSKPEDPVLSQDLDRILDGAFNFYRHTRNAIGHPQIIPDLDKGVILANLGQFIVYVERIYRLMDHFKANGVEV